MADSIGVASKQCFTVGSDLPTEQRNYELTKKYTNRIRAFFKARKGSKLISSDYSQLEPRCFSHVSGDSALQDIFRTGADFYSVIAQRTEGLTEVTKEARQKAKAYALGIPYGMTGYKLKFHIGTDQETADRLVKDYLSAFPQLARWMESSKTLAVNHGFVKAQTGRKRRLARAKQLSELRGPVLYDDLRIWKQFHEQPDLYERIKAERREFKNLLNNAINFQIQSLAASIVNRAAIAIMQYIASHGLKSHIVAQVHDELVFEVPESELKTMSTAIKWYMENVTKLDVPLIATPIVGDNFAECK